MTTHELQASAAPTVETSHASRELGALPEHDSPPMRRTAADRLMPYVAMARPDYWFKNVFMALGVLLAFFYHPELFTFAALWPVSWALAAVCITASSNYVLNEILDAPMDLHHPAKRHRPIPAGKALVPVAWALWLFLGVVGVTAAFALNKPFGCCALFLLLMGMVYNVPPVRAKELPYIDVLSESVNNPIRLLLGWFAVTAAEFPPVSLLIAYWMIGAFFMAAKRFAEYRSFADRSAAAAYRSSFRHYDEQKLLISMFFYTTCFALFLGVFIIRYHFELILIFPLIAGFVCYYLYIAFKTESAAQHPERLYREKGLTCYLFVCVVAFMALMFVRIPILYSLFNVHQSAVSPLWEIAK